MRTNRMVGVVSVAGIALIVLAPAAFAQGMKWRGSGGWGPGTAYGRIRFQDGGDGERRGGHGGPDHPHAGDVLGRAPGGEDGQG